MYIPFIQGDLFPTVYIIVTVIKRENIRSIQKMPPPVATTEGTEKVDYTVYIWYNVSIKYRRCFYDRTTAEIDAKSIHGNI